VKKAKQVGALLGGKLPGQWVRKTLRFLLHRIERSYEEKSERGSKRGMIF
jgi:hypothetical protein